MEDKILDTIKKYNLIQNEDKIVIGVSGGPDSMCLLNALESILRNKKLNYYICVAHINHGIRKEADEDEEYVKKYCREKNIECFVKKVDLNKASKDNKKGLEEMGREIRYQFFNEILKKVNANKIATAHTKNDNVETVLMNFIRGTGISGLRGIEPLRDGIYIRPLIECNRNEIENYCKSEGLNPKIDKTNLENVYTRNKIRNLLIPYIEKEFNPNIIETTNRLSILASKENSYFENIVKQSYDELKLEQSEKEIVLDLKKFNAKEDVIKSKIVRYTIKELLGTCQGIEKIHVDDILKLCSNNIGNKFLIPNKNIKVLVKNKKIFFKSNK